MAVTIILMADSKEELDSMTETVETTVSYTHLDVYKRQIFIRGFDPIMDNKYIPFGHPAFAQTADGRGKPYEMCIRDSC